MTLSASASAPLTRLLFALSIALLSFALPGAAVFFGIPVAVGTVLLLSPPTRREMLAGWFPRIFRFTALILVIRLAFELVTPEARATLGTETITTALLLAAIAACKVFLMLISLSIVVASSTAAQVMTDLESARMTGQFRLYALVTLQYPRQLARRHRLIEEAQRSRGMEPGRSLLGRMRFTSSIILPLVQSELDSIGDRAALMHSRGLDLPLAHVPGWVKTRSATDWLMLSGAVLVTAVAITLRVLR